MLHRAGEAAPAPLFLALVLAGVASLVVALRLHLIARAVGLSSTLGAAAGVNLSALFYGLFLPGGNVTGGAIRFYRLAGPERRISAAAGALLWDRFSATLALALAGLGFWVVAPPPKPAWPVLAFSLGAAAILGVMALATVMGRSEPGVVPARNGFGKAGSFTRRIVASLREVARPRPGAHARALALSLAAQLLGTAIYSLLAASVGIRIEFVAVGWIRAVVLLVLLLPVTISGLGVREGALMVLLAQQGVDEVPAVAFGLLVFATTVLAPGLAGGVAEGIRLVQRAG